MEHRQVIFPLILTWSAYQQIPDGAYKHMIGQCALANLINGAFYETCSAIRRTYYRR